MRARLRLASRIIGSQRIWLRCASRVDPSPGWPDGFVRDTMHGMLQRWILREPCLAFGLPVYGFAAVLFPLHLGWTGASWLAFAGYLLIAAALFSTADAVTQPALYPSWLFVVPQSLLSLFALAIPASLAFAIGSNVGPVDEAWDGVVCASQGAAEADTREAESDDTFDMTADCVVEP